MDIVYIVLLAMVSGCVGGWVSHLLLKRFEPEIVILGWIVVGFLLCLFVVKYN